MCIWIHKRTIPRMNEKKNWGGPAKDMSLRSLEGRASTEEGSGGGGSLALPPP